MCVEWVSEWEVTEHAITAYKVVRKVKGFRTKYVSPTKPGDRDDTQGGDGRGSVLDYRIGKEVESDEPGLYCIAHPMALAEKDMVLLEVVIPKGASIRRGRAGVEDEDGRTLEMRTINATRLKVAKVFKGKIDKRFNWPTTQVQQYNWSYITISNCSTSTAATYYYAGKPD